MSFNYLLLVLYVQVFLIFSASSAPPLRILQSPCPEIFGYEKAPFRGNPDWVFPSKDHPWRGVLVLPPSVPMFVRVKLLTPVPLPSKYVGRIELSEDKDIIVRKVYNGSLPKIKYYVYFPNKIPVPELISIEVNSRIVCASPPVPRRWKTILTLEHSLTLVKNSISLRRGFWKPPLLNDIQEYNKKMYLDSCGKSIFKNHPSSSSFPSVSIEDWPWMVPLFRKTEMGLQFLCSSTLVSFQYTVTAAHCINTKNMNPVQKEDIVAYAGRFDITKWTDEETQPREVSDIFIHPDFDPNTIYSDLAILKFSKPVELSPRVNPACIWGEEESLDAVVGKKGIVFGWGADGLGRKIIPTPNLAVMPIVSQEECLRSRMDFLFLTSNRTLCAGFRNGTGPCTGDSGGGLLLPRKDENGELRWVLRGVVSLSLLQNTEIMCDVEDYTVFTDVAKYKTWIADIMRDGY